MLRRIETILILISSIFLMVGCALFERDLVDRGKVSVEMVDSNEATYIDIRVSQKGTTVTVTGFLNLNIAKSFGAVPGHMDISLIDPAGEPVLLASAPYRWAHPGESWTHVKFELSAYTLLLEGSKVILRNHDVSMSTHLPLSKAD